VDGFSGKNYYEVLEIPTNATPEEVQEGYIRAKNAYTQDSLALYSLMSKEECQNILEMIDEAYTIISDPNKRAQYDDARNINNRYSRPEPTRKSNTFRPSSAPLSLEKEEVSTQTNITKIVAANKFALNYQVDAEFEQEIEQTTEFTGEFLKKIREYKNVDIIRMSDMTKVSKTYLLNIEEENIEKLPALVYVRGFVYQYAKCLKLNPDLVASSYLFRMKKLKGEA
jgi:hypothetical protein